MSFNYKIQRKANTYFSIKNSIGFINMFYQIKDVLSLQSIKRILIIGPGSGIITAVLKKIGFDVTTLDIDPELKPDFIGSVDDMNYFRDKQFDIVICSHVLEHLPFKYFEKSLSEIQRITKYALIYLPISGLKISFKIGLPKIGDKYINIYFHFSFLENINLMESIIGKLTHKVTQKKE